MKRNRAIIRTSRIGIAANFFLAAVKLAAGFAANSVSIIADAVNNISDAMSSVVTIIGTRLSEKEADRRHPFGYGRIEYVASLVIGMIILYAGFDAFKTSLDRILHPETSDYSAATLLVVSAAVVVKILMGLYTKKRGTDLDSEALKASGRDAILDSVASAATLAAAIIYMISAYSVEAWIGIVISLGVIKTGIETLRNAAGVILGKSVDIRLAVAVRKAICSFPEVEGVYDLVIHSYGKEKLLGSAHIEVADRYTVAWVDNLQRAIERKVREDTGVDMHGLSVNAINTQSAEVMAAREKIRAIVSETDGARRIHGFYVDLVDKTMNFDVEIGFDVRVKESLCRELLLKAREAYPDYDFKITTSYDYTE